MLLRFASVPGLLEIPPELLKATVTLVKFNVPPLKMPLEVGAVFPLTVEFKSVAVAPRSLKMPATPCPPVFPLTVEFVSVSVLVFKLKIPPPNCAVFPLTIEFVRIVVPPEAE